MQELLSNETLVSAAISLAAMLWAWVQTTRWWEERRLRIQDKIGAEEAKAIDALIDGIYNAYMLYIQPVLVRGSEVSVADKMKAKLSATRKASDILEKDGKTLAGVFGPGNIDKNFELALTQFYNGWTKYGRPWQEAGRLSRIADELGKASGSDVKPGPLF